VSTAPAPLLIGCDLDGTLLRSDGTVAARSVAAVARAEAAQVNRAARRSACTTVGRSTKVIGRPPCSRRLSVQPDRPSFDPAYRPGRAAGHNVPHHCAKVIAVHRLVTWRQ